MGVVIVIVLFIIAIALFLARQQNYISNGILQTILTIIGIISALVTVFVFVIPQASKPDPTEVGATTMEVLPTTTPEPAEAENVATIEPQAPTEMPTAPVLPSATSVPPSATEMPPTAMPTSQGSTMVGQDGMTLLYVPKGEFVRGSKEDDPNADRDEEPQRSIYLDAFWIDQTEVTNEMFATFLNKEGNQEEGGTTWLEIDDGDVLISESGGTFQSKEGFANHPVIEVSWYGAKAYCEWAGRRLPTEAEWEKAARGTDGRKYPWGNEDVAGNLLNLCDKNCSWSNRINSIDDGYARTAPVGTYPDGASPYGALDMAGNVWEWVADWYDAEYYKDAPENNPQGPTTGQYRGVRGGSWYLNGVRPVRAGNRYRVVPASRYLNNGVRCARSP